MTIKSTIFTIRDFKRIIDRPSTHGLMRSNLLASYARLRFLGNSGLKQTKILDYTVNYLDKTNLLLLFQDIFLGRIYEMSLENNRPTILDCGGNIGLSVLYFKSLFPESKILVFEPHPTFFQTLKENIENNKLTNVTAYQKAVSDKVGAIDFYLNDQENPGSLNMGIVQRNDAADCISVDADFLSNYISDDIDLLKLDIEGAEENVLIDLYRTGKLNKIQNIVCEYHHHIDEGVDRLSNTLKMLEDSGFGYQIMGYCQHPPRTGAYQDLIIYAFNKNK